MMANVSARAEPIVDYSTGAPAGTAVYDIAPGASGSIWFVESPTGEGNQFEVANMSSTGQVSASAQLTTGGSTQATTGVFVQLAPASDGGVWVTVDDALWHISTAGIVEPITLPPGSVLEPDGLTSGQDGDAWGLSCEITYPSKETASETCEALEVELDGHVLTHSIPSFSRTFPTSDMANDAYSSPPGLAFATEDGIWMDKPAVTSEGGKAWEAVFVSYSGTVTPAETPSDARLIAAGAGDAAWWEEPADGASQLAPTLTLGQVTPGGAATAVLVHNKESGDPQAAATFDAGPGGDLLWAEGTPGSGTHAGYMGTITPEGESRHEVGEYATAIAPPTPLGSGAWSLSPFFGSDLYQAANGDIWVVSGGDPGRISVLTPAGGFSTFLPLATGTEESQIWDMQQSSTGALWFSLDTPNVSSGSAGGVLARANPLSPPPGEPPFPGFGATTVSTTNAAFPVRSALPLAPVLGQSQTVRAISGTVRVRLKGTRRFVPLLSARTIPDGSEVDTTHGHVELTVATPTVGQTESAEAYGGQFLIHQERTGVGETHLTLSLPLTGCPRSLLTRRSHAKSLASGAEHRSGAKTRHLWVSEGGGSWGTNGRYVSTTVEGTHWLTLDECNRSEVQVVAGKVQVHDLIHNKTKILTTGKTYVAARGPSKRLR
jgi:hypothetical protein